MGEFWPFQSYQRCRGPGGGNTRGYTDRLPRPPRTRSTAMLSLLQVNVELDYIPHFLLAAPPDSA